MPGSKTNTLALEQQLLALQEEVALLRKTNADLSGRIKAYSLVNSGQTSLINKLIDKVPFGVMLVDDKGIISHVNEAAEKIFSISASQLKGKNSRDFFDTPKFSTEGLSEKKITLLDNGKYIMHSAFISDEGSEKVIVESFIDISEIKHAEQELIRVNRTKDEFLGMISHELRSPLNVIQGYSSLLEEEVKNLKNTDAISYVQHINKSGEKLLHVVSNLLDISDLTAGRIKANMIPIDLEIIVSQLQYRLEKEFASEGNELVFKCGNVPPFKQDLTLLMKVLYELLINANKFTEKGKVVVSINLQNKNGKDGLCFEISDTGCGMIDETVMQIFDAFHQADSSPVRAHGGLGLGLGLVEKIVKLIKGKIEVKSEIGAGSTFIVWVPYYAVSNA